MPATGMVAATEAVATSRTQLDTTAIIQAVGPVEVRVERDAEATVVRVALVAPVESPVVPGAVAAPVVERLR